MAPGQCGDAARPAARRSPLRAVLRNALRAALLWLAFACAAAVNAQGEEVPSLERRIKAAYLFKFTDYVSWPDGTFARPDAPLVIAVAGDEQAAADLAQTVAGHSVAGHPVTVRRLREGESPTGVNVLFVAGASHLRLEQAIRAAAGQPLLIVTEAEGALERGSVINFVLVGDHVKFEIALDNAEKRGLKLSSRLLAVAQNVRTAEGR
jgi:hypothetical protein